MKMLHQGVQRSLETIRVCVQNSVARGALVNFMKRELVLVAEKNFSHCYNF